MIARAKTHAADRGLNVSFRVESVDNISDPSGAYDAIHARVVLQFVPSIPAALSELRRVLKPNGRMRVSVPGTLSPIYNRSWRRHIEPENVGSNWVVPWELHEILVDSGWSVLDQWGELGESLYGEANLISQDEFAQIPLRLQQAAATTWTFVVR
jgi:SAM-dependent methyltransferase